MRFIGSVLCVLAVLASGCTSSGNLPAPPSSADPAKAQAVMRIVHDTMAQAHLKAAIVRVTRGGKEIVTQAAGESMAGMPATTSMFFRNGAVGISYLSTLLLRLVDEKRVRLDDKLSTWLPDVPNANRVTLRQLAQMTSGYPDYALGNADFEAALYADPFRQWTPEELLGYAVNKPLLYESGTNWNYAHTNYVLLGLALEKATGVDLSKLLQDKVFTPLALINTANSFTPQIPVPTLHAFTSERREALKIPAGTPFYEDSTFWNPSWTLARGAVQTTNIYDMEATAVGVCSGKLLSPESYKTMVAPASPDHPYGLGIVISGNWLLQNPMFAGEAGVEAYLPAQKIAIAVAVTYDPKAFDDKGNYGNTAETLFRKIGAALAPGDAPPLPREK